MTSHFGIRNIRNTPMRMLSKHQLVCIVPFNRVVPQEKHIASICDSIDSDDQIVECYEFFSEKQGTTTNKHGTTQTKPLAPKTPSHTYVDIKIMGLNIVISRDTSDETTRNY